MIKEEVIMITIEISIIVNNIETRIKDNLMIKGNMIEDKDDLQSTLMTETLTEDFIQSHNIKIVGQILKK